VQISLQDVGGQMLRVGIRRGDTTRPPLLLFNGIGANIELVEPFLAAFAGPEAITFDVPGVGGSPAPMMPYRPRGLARLAAQLLDQLGYDAVDVLGVSWGGTLAQQFAFQHPRRCRRLILAATSPGHLMVPGKLSVLLKMATPRRYKDPDYMRAIAGDIYGGALRGSPELVRQHLRHVRWSSDYGYYLQLIAATGWSSLPWLRFLAQPTLVLMGTDDPIVPIANGRILERLIPDAQLETIDDGHLFLVTSAARSAQIIARFLDQHAGGQREER
jgi:poly(3-hydroxyalkanoate) depolymerase